MLQNKCSDLSMSAFICICVCVWYALEHVLFKRFIVWFCTSKDAQYRIPLLSSTKPIQVKIWPPFMVCCEHTWKKETVPCVESLLSTHNRIPFCLSIVYTVYIWHSLYVYVWCTYNFDVFGQPLKPIKIVRFFSLSLTHTHVHCLHALHWNICFSFVVTMLW